MHDLMAHLKRHSNGHLYKTVGGHLMKDCTGATEGLEEPPPENTCNDCDPPLPDTISVTFLGLLGDLEPMNGTHEVTWTTSCSWRNETAQTWVTLDWAGVPDPPYWHSVCGVATPPASPVVYCFKHWAQAEGDPCDPTADEYDELTCSDSECTDTDTCENSAGATCVVSTS